MLPDNAAETILGFLELVWRTIDTFNVKGCNIDNFDQVPRYFENHSETTITTKGAKNVKTRKASTGHKRFTASFRISRSGKIQKPHALFSNLKKKPTVSSHCDVDVNGTSMWSFELIEKYYDNVYAESDKEEHYLHTLDSYGAHMNFVEQRAEKYPNFHFILIPPNFTSLLQPLDVCHNKSFQESFGDSYNAYIKAVFTDPQQKLFTKHGNPKMPTYLDVTEWMVKWTNELNKKPEKIAHSFDVCGICPRNEYDPEKLHKPLKDLLINKMEPDEWIHNHHEIMENENFYDLKDTQFFWPPTNDDSFIRCIKYLKRVFHCGLQIFKTEYTNKLVSFIDSNQELRDLFDEEDEILLRSGSLTGSQIEMFALASLENWSVKLTELDKYQNLMSCVEFNIENPSQIIHLVNFDGFVICELNQEDM